MKILNPIGSKERFLEMFQGVNKVQLNELSTNVMQTGTQLVEKAFEELKNKVAQIKQTNTQVVGEDNFVEIITIDNEGNQITFTFKVNSTEADQDGVYNVDNAVLTKFKLTSERFNVEWEENMKFLQEFNANHGSEIMNVVSEFANFETDTASIDDEMYEEAIKLIDKVPYRKGTETMQTNKAYADQKPTNPKLRVHSDELTKFVSEMEDYVNDADAEEEDIFALPNEHGDNELPNDDGSRGIDPYDQETDNSGENDWEISGKKPEKPKYHPPYMDKTPNKERAVPSWAADLLEDNVSSDNNIGADQYDQQMADAEKGRNDWEVSGKKLRKPKQAPPYMKNIGNKERAVPNWVHDLLEDNVVADVNADNLVQQNYKKLLSPEVKQYFITMADNILKSKLGAEEQAMMPKSEYFAIVKSFALKLYQQGSAGMNEEQEKGEYPDQIGKKFKPKNQMPKKKKKPQSVVKLSEESEIPKEYWGNPEDEMNEGNDIEQTILDKEETGDEIEGGKADNDKPTNFDSEQLAMGLKIEMEHTDDPMVAIEIAMDHLSEIPDYYTHLDKMEKNASVDNEEKNQVEKDNPELYPDGWKEMDGMFMNPNSPMHKSENDEETDELLGYKPHNVNDYANEEFDYAGAEREYSDKEGYDDNADNKNNDIPENFWQEFQSLIDEFGEHIVNYLFNNGLRGYYETVAKGNYTIDDVKRTLEMLKGSEVNENDTEEYQDNVGDRYQDAEGNQLTVRNKENDSVGLQSQEGDKEIATQDLQYLKKLGESVETAKKVLKDRGFNTEMTKKEAVLILIKHNIK